MVTKRESGVGKTRLEAFSDGVIAIVITIMVLELKVPHGGTLADLGPMLPVLLGYLLSFTNVGIYWNNHHHMLHTVSHVSGKVLWANLHLLFWLSLIPVGTAWMSETHFAPMPIAIYGVVLLMCGVAYFILQQLIIASQGPHSVLRAALGTDWKGKGSVVVYLIAVAMAFVAPWVALSLYVLVALVWLVPDPRIERVINAPPRRD